MPRSAASIHAAAAPDHSDAPPVPVRPRHDGWTADRQRRFLTALAETGSVTQAAADCGLSARSAYRLRARSDALAFANGWDKALRIAAGRLTAIAYERAITGRVKQFWKDGELVATTREPSDRLLMFLVDTLYYRGYGGSRTEQTEASARRGRGDLPAVLDRLTDNDCATEFIQNEDLFGMTLSAPDDSDEEPDT